MKRIFLIFFVLLGILGNSLYAQERRVTGTVTDADTGTSLPGVTVAVQGTTLGAVTDLEGRYELSVPAGAVLEFSFIGMNTETVTVGERTIIDVAMVQDIATLQEVIITAGVAGATPRNKMSVTVNQVGAEQLQAVPATSAATALQGKVSGVTIVQASGNPGQAAGIRLRGSTQLFGDQSPLIILDGVMIEGDLADINMDDIESMEVVKGAAASALYGSRAGAGVIVITSRRGGSAREGTTNIRIRNEFGVSNLQREVPINMSHHYNLAADWEDHSTFTKYAGITYPDGYVAGLNNAIEGNRTVKFDGYADNPFAFTNNHQDRIFQDGTFYTNYVGVAHNAGKTRIFTSFENSANSGIVWNTTGNNRQNFRLNADHWFGEVLSLSMTSLVAQNRIDVADGRFTSGWGGGQGSAFFDMLFFDPDTDFELDAPDGAALPKYNIHPNHWQSDNGNPLHALYYQDQSLLRRNILQSFQARYFLTDFLSFDGTYSLERFNNFRETYQPKGFYTSQSATQGRLYKSSIEGMSNLFNLTANFDQDFGELSVRAKASYIYEEYLSESFFIDAADLVVANIQTLNAISGEKVVGSSTINTRARNYLAIVDADYRDRYIVSALFRMDGSSLFGENERWNPYYRVSGAYRIAEEFDIPGVSELRIRGSYGISGIRPGFNYQYENYSVSQGSISKSTIGNSDLRPSETEELEFGLNAEFLNIFDLEITYADINTNGAFLNVPLPAAAGFAFQWQNAADIKARAFEVQLGAQLFNTRDFRWRLGFNFDQITQEITRMDAAPFRTGPTVNALQVFYVKAGEPYGIMYGGDWVRTLEQMQAQLPAGTTIDDFIINSDGYVIRRGTEGTINESPYRLLDEEGGEAFVQIADMNPDFNLSVTNSLTYKGLNVNMLWHWKQGGDVYNQTKQWLYRDERHGDFDQAGKDPNQKKVASYYYDFYRINEPNSFFVEDGTFLKLREVSVYYTFNAANLRNANLGFMQSVRFGVIGRNLLTFTNYSGWDPEVAQVDYANSNSTNFMIDMFNYPNFRTFTFSLEVNF